MLLYVMINVFKELFLDYIRRREDRTINNRKVEEHILVSEKGAVANAVETKNKTGSPQKGGKNLAALKFSPRNPTVRWRDLQVIPPIL